MRRQPLGAALGCCNRSQGPFASHVEAAPAAARCRLVKPSKTKMSVPFFFFFFFFKSSSPPCADRAGGQWACCPWAFYIDPLGMADDGLVFKKAKGARRSAKRSANDDVEDGTVLSTSKKLAASAEPDTRARTDDVQYSTDHRTGGEVLAGDEAEAQELQPSSAPLAGGVTEDGEKIYTGEQGYATYIRQRESLISKPCCCVVMCW
jgi:hypothetical protein